MQYLESAAEIQAAPLANYAKQKIRTACEDLGISTFANVNPIIPNAISPFGAYRFSPDPDFGAPLRGIGRLQAGSSSARHLDRGWGCPLFVKTSDSATCF